MVIVIYYDDSKKNKLVIKPSPLFNGDVRGLIETVTHSNLEPGVSFRKTYHHFDVIN